jgi:TldD protein
MKSFIKNSIDGLDADYIEVRVEDSYLTDISIQNKNIDLLSKSHNYGACVRAFVKGGWGFVSLNNLDNLKEAARTAVYIANIVSNERKDNSQIASSNKVEIDIKADLINDFRNFDIEEKKKILESYNKIVLTYSKNITNSKISYFDSFKTVHFYNTEGSFITQEKADLGVKISAFSEKKGDTEVYSLGFGSSNDFGVIYNKEEKVESICKDSLSLLNSENINKGIYTVVLNPVLAGVFIHEAFGHLSESDNLSEDDNLKKVMVLGRRFGKDILNVYDTGLEKGKRGYLLYDDEGIKSDKTYLIKDGLLTGRLSTRESAFCLGEKPTGNARSINYKYPPICRMRITCIENGVSSLDDLFSNIKNGVYAIDAYGGQTDGEMFTFTASKAYMIKNGKISNMVKNIKLTGNVFNTLMNISMIGNDFIINDSYGGCCKGEQTQLPVSSGSPHIRIENVIIG